MEVNFFQNIKNSDSSQLTINSLIEAKVVAKEKRKHTSFFYANRKHNPCIANVLHTSSKVTTNKVVPSG